MSKYCYSTGTRTDTTISTTFLRSTSFRTSVFTALPTGTQITGTVTTTRIPSVVSFPTAITRKSTYYKTTCTTYRAGGGYAYPYYGYSKGPLSTGLIAIIVVAGLWYAVFFAVCIYLLCFSKTAKYERQRKKGQGGFGKNQFPNTPLQQQYTPVPQDPLYARGDTQYPPPNNLPYGGMQQNLNPGPQNQYNPYQNYNAPNVGVQGMNQWATQNPSTPSAASFVSGPGPGYIPPGAANPMLGSPGAGTVSYSMSSTTPSPPPGPGSDPHRVLYAQQNDRLSAAVSLVHPYQPTQEQPSLSSYSTPYQQQPHEQPSLSSYSTPYQQQSQEQPSLSSYSTPYQQSPEQPARSSYPPGPPFGQPQQQQTPSQAQLAAQYRGYAEPSTMNPNQNQNPNPNPNQNYGRI